MEKEPEFTNINDSVCMYCSKIIVFDYPGVMDVFYGCKKRKTDKGKYIGIDDYENSDEELTTFEKGCKNFESSGLPAHSLIIEELKRRNYLAESIPVDENATETAWDFLEKMKKYLSKQNILSSIDKIL